MPQSKDHIRIFYVGDSWLTAGTLSAGTGFSYDLRGVSVENAAEPILERWRKNARYQVSYLAGWDVLARFPETPERLKQHDIIILSDVDSDSLVLYPMERANRFPMGPNRLKLIREFVRQGGALWMIGGYYSFTGRQNLGNYSGTPVEEALPVKCLDRNDDRLECPEGVTVEVTAPGHIVMRNISWTPGPMFTGYNRLEPKPESEVLARFKETGDPLLAVWHYGKGRAMALASDISPHWGAGFQQWEYFGQFLDQAVEWLAAR
jgi:uncharacterized membrane protein